MPAPLDRAWRSVSVTSHECLGAAKCGYADDCFAEAARARSREVDVVVTNHAMLAIDAFAGIPLLPEHDAVVVDEAHELVDRATDAVTDELTQAMVERAARRARKHVEPQVHEDLLRAAEALGERSSPRPTAAASRPREARCSTRSWPSATRPRGAVGVRRQGPRRGARRRGRRGARSRPAPCWRRCTRSPARIVAAGEHDVLLGPHQRAPAAGPAPRAAVGGRAAPRAAVRRPRRRAHERHAGAGRLLRRRRPLAWAPRRRRGGVGSGLARTRRRLAVRLPAPGHPVRRPPAAAAGPRRTEPGAAGRAGGARRGRRRPHAGAVLLPAGGGGRGRGAARAARRCRSCARATTRPPSW